MRSSSTEVVALRTIVSATKSTLERWHAKLAHGGVDTIKSSAKHEVATGLDIKPSTGADLPCVLCVGGKLAQQTFPDKGSDAEEALAVVHIDLCGPFWVSAKDGSLYFLLLKDCHTRFIYWGGEFLGKEFTNFVNGKGIVHNLMCPYPPQQNGMAEREMRTVVESVRTMLLHMGVQHHWWHLALREAVWVRNCLEQSTTPPGTTSYQLLTGKKPDLTLVWEWGCMVQFMVPEQQRGGKLAPKARWGLHLGVSPESNGWETGRSIGEQPVEGPTLAKRMVDDEDIDKEGDLLAREESTNSDVVEVPVEKEALASWKGEAVKAAMDEEIRSLIDMGTWELVERPRGVNITKNRWVLTTKYRIDDTIERKKARLVVKGFTQVYVANYDDTYSSV
ncbi:unnamed protein product [Closterium sp. NIES-54]